MTLAEFNARRRATKRLEMVGYINHRRNLLGLADLLRQAGLSADLSRLARQVRQARMRWQIRECW